MTDVPTPARPVNHAHEAGYALADGLAAAAHGNILAAVDALIRYCLDHDGSDEGRDQLVAAIVAVTGGDPTIPMQHPRLNEFASPTMEALGLSYAQVRELDQQAKIAAQAAADAEAVAAPPPLAPVDVTSPVAQTRLNLRIATDLIARCEGDPSLAHLDRATGSLAAVYHTLSLLPTQWSAEHKALITETRTLERRRMACAGRVLGDS